MTDYLQPFTEEANHKVYERLVSEEPLDFKSKDLYTLSKVNRNYSKQFSSMYYNRLNELKQRLLQKCETKWKSQLVNDIQPVYVDKILDVQNGKPSWIIGTIFSDLKYKPNVLKEVAETMYGGMPLPSELYSDPENDQIMIEDESGRIILAGALMEKTILVSGNVVGLLGAEVQPGIFEVLDICYPELAPQQSRSTPAESGHKIAFVSGLGINPSDFESCKLELLKEYLIGDLMPEDLQHVTRLVIAGNSTLINQQIVNEVVNEKEKYKALNKSNFSTVAIELLDDFLKDVLSSVPVTIMPGESDPAEVTYPQLPLHSSFFHKNKQLIQTTHFKRTTNPAWLQFDSCRVLGTSGENITDIYKYLLPLDKVKKAKELGKDQGLEKLEEVGELVTLCPEDSRMPIIESTLHCQNIVPTAPDTLCCYPYDDDPFLLRETPHVYFVGNQPKFETKVVSVEGKDVRLISIPRFDLTGEIVLMDTTTLECEVVKISSEEW